MKTITCGALFAGIGGFCQGFEAAGFETLWASDFDQQVMSTYRHNSPNVKFYDQSIQDLDFNSLEPVDVLHAGFPCQPFSHSGNRQGFNDPKGRGILFDVMMDKIESANWKPKVLLLENSTYIQYGENGMWFDHIRKRLQRAGFWFSAQNALTIDTRSHAGLPQRRERLFMHAVSKNWFDYNPFNTAPPDVPTLKMIDLLELGANHDAYYYLAENNRYGNWIYTEGVKLGAGRLIQLRQSILRPQPANMCPTLTANMGMGGHNVPFIIDRGSLRKLTERECLRLQGFDDTFSFPDLPRHACYRMIGNSVSPKVSKLIAKTISSELEVQENERKLAV